MFTNKSKISEFHRMKQVYLFCRPKIAVFGEMVEENLNIFFFSFIYFLNVPKMHIIIAFHCFTSMYTSTFCIYKGKKSEITENL